MAKLKKEFHMEVGPNSGIIRIWCNQQHWGELLSIEGVAYADALTSIGQIILHTDPRYDINEIADEIRVLLESEVPDIFRN